jgi:hypothetical protein
MLSNGPLLPGQRCWPLRRIIPTVDKQPSRVKALLAHAFAIEAYDETSLSEDERAALLRVAEAVHAKRLTAAVIAYVEAHRNFNFFGSQALVFVSPLYDLGKGYLNALLRFLGFRKGNVLALSTEEMNVLAGALEKRYSIEYFIQRLEELEAGGKVSSADGSPRL